MQTTIGYIHYFSTPVPDGPRAVRVEAIESNGFDFQPNILHGQLLADFLCDFNITTRAWSIGNVTGHPINMPLERLKKWRSKIIDLTNQSATI